LLVRIATTTLGPVDALKDDPATTRRIGARIGEFAAVGTVFSETGLLATSPAVLMASEMELHNLRALRQAVTAQRFQVRFVWSSRLGRDLGNLWLRTLLMGTYERVQAEANALVEAHVAELSGRSIRAGVSRAAP
jgi:hypothetical protein